MDLQKNSCFLLSVSCFKVLIFSSRAAVSLTMEELRSWIWLLIEESCEERASSGNWFDLRDWRYWRIEALSFNKSFFRELFINMYWVRQD